jgi:hypothetical protein
MVVARMLVVPMLVMPVLIVPVLIVSGFVGVVVAGMLVWRFARVIIRVMACFCMAVPGMLRGAFAGMGAAAASLLAAAAEDEQQPCDQQAAWLGAHLPLSPPLSSL